MLGVGIGVGSTVSIGDTTPPTPPEGLLAAATALEALHDVPDDEGGWTGFTTEVFDTTVNCTTPNAVKAAIATWAADPSKLLDITCDWDGPLDLTGYFTGVPNSILTADAGAWGGYQRPAGGVRVRNKDGKTPCFGNFMGIYAFPKLEFNGVGFAAKATTGPGPSQSNSFAIQIQNVSGWNLPGAYVFKNCLCGITPWRADNIQDYCRAITTNSSRTLSVHVENCEFNGVLDVMGGGALFWRVWNNYCHNFLGDFCGVFWFAPERLWVTTDRSNIWAEGNVVCDYVDDAGYTALHGDFLQTGAAADAHAGYSVLCRENMVHMSAENIGNQGNFNSDYQAADNEICVYNNLFSLSAYHGVQVWDSVGNRSQFVESNTIVASGRRNGDTTPWIKVSNNDGLYGLISIKGNILADLQNPYAFTLATADNLYCNPRKTIVSGDGTTTGTAKRPEEVFKGLFLRDSADLMTFDLTGEGDSKTASFYAIADQFEPIGGWGSAGCSNPETWAMAPVRP